MYFTYSNLLIIKDCILRGEKYIPHSERIHIIEQLNNEIRRILKDAKACGEE